MNREQAYLLYLIKSALTKEIPRLPKAPFNWDSLAEYAEKQQFEQILYPLFQQGNPGFSEKTWFHLQQRYGITITQCAEQELELEKISDTLSENMIPHIHLKGESVKCYYAYPEQRISVDFDILIDKTDREKAISALADIGYQLSMESHDDGLHDVLYRGKFHIELHKEPVIKESVAQELCNLIWEYSYQSQGLTYAMKESVLYAYLLEHLRKHLLFSGGAGIKLIVDFYAMSRSACIDKDELEYILRKTNMLSFNNCVLQLVDKWFNDAVINDENVLMLESLILNSQAYGNYTTHIKMVYLDDMQKKYTSKKKAAVYIRRAFPGFRQMVLRYPILEKIPFLLPVMWIIRFFDTDKNTVRVKLNALNALDTDEAKRLSDFIKNISQ